MPTLNNELATFLKSQGASLVGYADLHEIDVKSRDNFPFGISIAMALNPRIMSEITAGPSRRYYDEYERLNGLLDNLGKATERFLTQKGYSVQARPTTFGADSVSLHTKLPHKTVATRAGLGWVGKCALLVTKEYGSAVRLTTVLTDAPFSTGKPIDASRCGDCTKCADVCPGHAVTGKNWQSGINREALYDAFACRNTAQALSIKGFGIKITLCGRCIIACPWTQKYLKASA